jgi:dolichol-phosphate mannosyltransferase
VTLPRSESSTYDFLILTCFCRILFPYPESAAFQQDVPAMKSPLRSKWASVFKCYCRVRLPPGQSGGDAVRTAGVILSPPDARCLVSIVIPVKDEAPNIEPLAAEINGAMASQAYPWEVLWVDDGSRDQTLSLILELERKDPRHRHLSFTANCGQSAALVAGFRESQGDVIATLDGDGQNDPQDLPRLIALLLGGEADMVNGYRERRRDGIGRKLASAVGNGFRTLMTGRSVRDVGCSTRVLRRECVSNLPLFKGLHRFLPTIISWRGFRLMEVPVNHRPRARGTTKYGIHNRLWVGLYDLFGVMWLRKRALHYVIRERSE